MFNTIFANDRIRPEDLCSRKQLIYLLSHNHCPQKSFYNICPFARLQRGRCQCDQIGRFLKFLATKFLPKEAQNNWQLLGYFEKPHSFGKTTTLGASFGKIGLLLLQHLVTLVVAVAATTDVDVIVVITRRDAIE